MKRLLSLTALAAFLLPIGAQAQDAQSIERGKQASMVCAACHMPDGRGSVVPNVEARPRITGLDPVYFVKQLQDYKSGARDNASMKPMATMLSDEQMQDVANYFASLPVVHDVAQPASEEMMKLGERLVKLGEWDRFIPACVSCHGAEARGAGANFPNLNGQPAEYTEQQLIAWQKGTRKNDLLGLMKPIAERLNENEIKALAAWFAAQPAQK